MPGKLFGTDGVRGRANVDITPDLAMGLARAAGEGRSGPAVVGRDTRRSGQMLADALHAGFHSVGVDTVDAGIVPAGGLSYVTRDLGASFGVLVSASHNPAADNGIKFFGKDGGKLADEREADIERRFLRGGPWKLATGPDIGIRQDRADSVEGYVEHLIQRMPYSLQGVELALDCANGAAFRAAPMLFESLKAGVEVFAAEPDGTNINLHCGATNPHALARLAGGRLGLAFDGDADRLVAIDEEGKIANGDVVIAVIAAHLKETGALRDDLVVVTVMANLGFRRAMERLGIDVVETAVGDRYVLEEMRMRRASLGGEQSGHVILEDRVTGDGLATALKLLEVMAASGRPLAELRQVMTEYPQVLRSVAGKSASGRPIADQTPAAETIAEVEAELGDEGRVLVRPSGTEPITRVMVEAPTAHLAAECADRVAAAVRATLGPNRENDA